MEHAGEEKLQVKMLGGFFVSYQNRPIAFGRGSTAKAVQLLQILFLHIDSGISKEELLQLLYDWESVGDRNRSLNSMIYRLKKQLAAAGLPGREFISIKNGICRWSGMAADIDIFQFQDIMRQAQQVKPGTDPSEEERKLALLQHAFSIYQGEFLPQSSCEVWAAAENVRLKELYYDCIEQLCRLLDQRREYQQMLDIYEKVKEIYPYEEWQVKEIDCLIQMRRYKEAYQLYQETERLYAEELNLPPTRRMLEQLEIMGGRLINQEDSFDRIKQALDEKHPLGGAYFCPYPSFVDLYHIARRNRERTAVKAALMMCAISSRKEEKKRAEEASRQLCAAISQALRRGDVYTRFSSSQYLILLNGVKDGTCSMIFERIQNRFEEAKKNPDCRLICSVDEI